MSEGGAYEGGALRDDPRHASMPVAVPNRAPVATRERTGIHRAVLPLAAAFLAVAAIGSPTITPRAAADEHAAVATDDESVSRRRAPPFALPGPDGRTLRLADYRGEVVYLDFWASWCAPCRKSFPWMNALAERHAADGLRVVAIGLDAEREAGERFLDAVRADFDVAFDTAASSAEAYGILGMPSSYVIDRAGRIAHAHVGFRSGDKDELEAVIGRVLAEPVPASGVDAAPLGAARPSAPRSGPRPVEPGDVR